MKEVVLVKEYSFIYRICIFMKENDYEQDSLIHDFSEMTAAQLYDYEIPDIYEFIDAMPLTGMGKVDYRALEA